MSPSLETILRELADGRLRRLTVEWVRGCEYLARYTPGPAIGPGVSCGGRHGVGRAGDPARASMIAIADATPRPR